MNTYLIGLATMGVPLVLATMVSYGIDLAKAAKGGEANAKPMSNRTRLLHRSLGAFALILGVAIVLLGQ
jgi:hypothetical protein